MLDLQPIKARLAAATPGPWTRQELDDDPEGGGVMYLSTSICNFEDEGVELAHAKHDNDADLIAHAPSDLAALVAEVERLREAITQFGADTDRAQHPRDFGAAYARLMAVLNA